MGKIKLKKLPSGELTLYKTLQKEKERDRAMPLDVDSAISMLKSNRRRASYNELIIESLPDVSRHMSIIASAILSPNDLNQSKLSYGIDALLPSELKSTLTSMITDFSESTYGMSDKLETIVSKGLFKEGAYIMATIPVNTIVDLRDKVIKIEAGTEKKIKEKRPPVIATTNVLIEGVSDLSALGEKDKLTKKHLTPVDTTFGVETAGLEKFSKTSDALAALYKDYNSALSVADASEYDFSDKGAALCKSLPVDSVAPIYKPGLPEEHVGYLCFIGENGHPLSLSQYNGSMDELSSKDKFIKAMTGNSSLSKITEKLTNIKNMDELYNTVIGADIKKIVDNNTEEDIGDIDLSQDVKDLMLTRSLRELKTKVMYIPKDKLTYIAFETRDNGTGKSVLEKIRLLASMRVTLLMARMNINLKNSIGNTKVVVQMDDDEIDPDGFMADTMAACVGARANVSDAVTLDHNVINDKLHKAGFTFLFKGKGLPDYEIDITDDTRSFPEPDIAMDEELRKQIALAFDLPIKLAEDGASDTLATAIRENKEMMGKYISTRQKVINNGITKQTISLIKNSPRFIEKMIAEIDGKVGKLKQVMKADKSISNGDIAVWVVNMVIDKIKVTLPTIEITDEDGTKQAFDSKRDFVEQVVDLYISDMAIGDVMGGDMSDKISELRDTTVSAVMREWVTANNFLPEVSELIQSNEFGKKHIPILEDALSYRADIAKPIINILRKANKLNNSTNKKIADIEDDDVVEEEETVTPEAPVEGEEPPVEEPAVEPDAPDDGAEPPQDGDTGAAI